MAPSPAITAGEDTPASQLTNAESASQVSKSPQAAENVGNDRASYPKLSEGRGTMSLSRLGLLPKSLLPLRIADGHVLYCPPFVHPPKGFRACLPSPSSTRRSTLRSPSTRV